MKELFLKYGCNPNQKPAKLKMRSGGELPLRVLNGAPGYINFLDALNAWQLVKALKASLKLPAAASFKHVSPAGAAVGLPLTGADRKAFFVDEEAEVSPLAAAYVRARGADRLSSFGDFIALSDVCDVSTAKVIQHEVSDGIIAPGYEKEALEILSAKRKGSYAVIEIDEGYVPASEETRDVFGITLCQGYNDSAVDGSLLTNIVTDEKYLPESAKRDLVLALLTLKYTQSNSVCFAKDGQVIGNGAGQQSRVHCTRLAGRKADLWQLRRHPRVLALPFLPSVGRPDRDNAVDAYLSDRASELLQDTGRWFTRPVEFLTSEEKQAWLKQADGVSLASDAFFPFADNIDRAMESGVRFIAQPGGSVRDDLVIERCNQYHMVMAMTGLRLFHH